MDYFLQQIYFSNRLYEILAEYTVFQSGDERLIIKFFIIDRYHKEIFVKCYLTYNVVIPRLDRGIQCF
jgi:hypothetical protein